MPLKRIDTPTWIALACVLLGWFGLNTLVATFGFIQHEARFYDLPEIMREPRWLLTGVGGTLSTGTVIFAIVCLLAAAAPLLPRLGYPRIPWLLHSAPLLLMVLCGIAVYVKASNAHIAAPDSMGRLGGYVAHWVNSATDWSGDVVARHIQIGAGGYLAFLASGWLAVKGVVDLRASARGARSSAGLSR